MEIKEVFITSYTTGGTPVDDLVVENLSLNFAEYKLTYTPQKPDGTADASIHQGWSVKENKTVG